MDALARLQPGTAGLLDRVDDTLARWGAPDGHPVWSLLRRTGALPGDAVAGLAAWPVQHWTEQADELRGQAEAVLRTAGGLAALPGWEGRAGEAFAGSLHASRREAAQLAARLGADAEHRDELARIVTDGRLRVARVLARVTSSTEAVALVTGCRPDGRPADPGTVPAVRAGAAAEIATVLLIEIDALLTELDELVTRGPAEPPWEPAVSADVSSPAATLRVGP